MSEQSAKKIFTPAQLAAHQASRNRATKIKEQSANFFKRTGLSARVPYPGMYVKMKTEGKSDEEIEAALRKKINNNTATRKAKSASKATNKAAPTPVAKANQPLGEASSSTSAAVAAVATPKVKSNKKEAANKAQSNTAQKFRNRNLKAYPQAVSYYITQKKAGKNDDTIFAEIKGRNNLQKAPVRTRRNNGAKKANAAVVAPLAAVNQTVSANKGVAKGQWVCEKCRLVANNTTRKNNNKNAGNNFNMNAYNWY